MNAIKGCIATYAGTEFDPKPLKDVEIAKKKHIDP